MYGTHVHGVWYICFRKQICHFAFQYMVTKMTILSNRFANIPFCKTQKNKKTPKPNIPDGWLGWALGGANLELSICFNCLFVNFISIEKKVWPNLQRIIFINDGKRVLKEASQSGGNHFQPCFQNTQQNLMEWVWFFALKKMGSVKIKTMISVG